MHSPYMFDLLTKIFDDHKEYYIFEKIETIRREFRKSTNLIQDLDLGAGSHKVPGASRTIAQIAGSAVSSPRKCEVLFRLAEHLQPKVTIELGSSLGISTAYLASAYANGHVSSFEGNPDLAKIAREVCDGLDLSNIDITCGNFDDVLPSCLDSLQDIDLAYFDGNHRKEPTLKYYEMLRSRCSQNAVFFIDDIRWSSEMFDAWKEMKNDPAVRATVDAFSFGLLFFSPIFKERLDLTVIPDRITGGPIFR